MTRPRAILFDLDGTLVNDEMAADRAWEEACRDLAARLGLAGYEALLGALKAARREYWGRPANRVVLGNMLFPGRLAIVRAALAAVGCLDDVLAVGIVNAYATAKPCYMKVVDGAASTLTELAGAGVKVALVTNGESTEQRATLRVCGLERTFPVCLIGGELGYGKPDGRIFRLALQDLEVSAGEAWMVGDNLEVDIGGAQATGIAGVWCDYGNKGLPVTGQVMPDMVIHSVGELLGLIPTS